MGMVDVTEKPIVHRKAEAAGKILLSPRTVEEIKAGRIKKGNPLQVAELAAMTAAKQTHLLIHTVIRFLWIRLGWILSFLETLLRRVALSGHRPGQGLRWRPLWGFLQP